MARASRFKFTDEIIEKLPVPRRRAEYADTTCQGLRLRVGTSGVRSFVFYEREEDGRRRGEILGRWSRTGVGGTLTVEAARARFLDRRGQRKGLGSSTSTVRELLDFYIERGKPSTYTASLLRKHLASVEHVVAATLGPAVLPDLVAKVQGGYADDKGKQVGGPAVADKFRGALVSMFALAQRAGRFPPDKQLPTLGLAREDFAEIGWKARERVPSERELHRLFDALGIGAGERIEIDLNQSPRIALASRLAVLLLLHVPVRSGAGILSQRAAAVDRKAKVLRWRTRKGGRVADLETPLSAVALDVLRELEQLKGGKAWIVPSPEDPTKPIDLKVVTRLFARLQTLTDEEGEPRVAPDEGQEPFTPHCLRALWVTLAGEIGIDDGVAVRVIGHQPEGASKAQRFYDRSQRLDAQRDAVERVSAELERIRRRLPVATAAVVKMGSGAKA
jgi:hypothetical protein